MSFELPTQTFPEFHDPQQGWEEELIFQGGFKILEKTGWWDPHGGTIPGIRTCWEHPAEKQDLEVLLDGIPTWIGNSVQFPVWDKWEKPLQIPFIPGSHPGKCSSSSQMLWIWSIH